MTGSTQDAKVVVDRDGPGATITLNRPEVHNALDRELSTSLNGIVRELKDDRSLRVVVLRGAGGTFCSGDDVREFNEWGPDDAFWQVRTYQETVNILEDLPSITIAALNEVCTGGDLELTLVCDFVIATENSRWGMPEIDWEITPGGAESRGSDFLLGDGSPRSGICSARCSTAGLPSTTTSSTDSLPMRHSTPRSTP